MKTTIETNTATETNGWQGTAGQPVLVQCAEYRCLGYRDDEGIWRTFFSGEVLPPVVAISELAS